MGKSAANSEKTATASASSQRLDKANDGRGSNLEPYKFQPGKSGNPSGKSKRFEEIRTVARQHSTKAILRLVELVGSEDERVALLAAREILDRGFGRPKPAGASDADQGQLTINIVRFSEDAMGPEGPDIEPTTVTVRQLAGP
jgi:hypothetical protein